MTTLQERGRFSLQANVLVVPLFREVQNAEKELPQVLSARQALRQDRLRIRETGNVPELVVEVIGDVLVLLPESEVLVGGGQNRTPVATVLLGQGQHRVPVRCVQQARWNPQPGQPFTRLEHTLPYAVRLVKYQSALKESGTFSPDQGAMWRSISDALERAQVRNRTEDVTELFQSQAGKSARSLAQQFTCLPDQCGMMLFVQGHLLGIEWMPTPEMWQEHHTSVLMSYFVQMPVGLNPQPLDAREIALLWDRLRNQVRELPPMAPPAGVGTHRLINYPVGDSRRLMGMALEHEGRLYALSALAA